MIEDTKKSIINGEATDIKVLEAELADIAEEYGKLSKEDQGYVFNYDDYEAELKYYEVFLAKSIADAMIQVAAEEAEENQALLEEARENNEAAEKARAEAEEALQQAIADKEALQAELDSLKFLGDANHDGAVNVRDCAYIAKCLAESRADVLPALADFNQDGEVNIRDAAALAKYLVFGINHKPEEQNETPADVETSEEPQEELSDVPAETNDIK